MFSIRKAVRFGWETFKAHWGLLIGSSLVVIVLGFIPSFAQGNHRMAGGIFIFLVAIVAVVLRFIVQIGYTKIILKLHDGQPAEIKDLFKYYSLFWRYLWTQILTGLVIGIPVTVAVLIIVGIAFLLFAVQKALGIALIALLVLAVIVAAVYFSIRIMFSLFYVVDTDIWGSDAIKKSWNVTRNEVGHLFKFALVCMALNLLGTLVFFIGLFVTVPVTLLSVVYVYRKISEASAEVITAPETGPTPSSSEAIITA